MRVAHATPKILEDHELIVEILIKEILCDYHGDHDGI